MAIVSSAGCMSSTPLSRSASQQLRFMPNESHIRGIGAVHCIVTSEGKISMKQTIVGCLLLLNLACSMGCSSLGLSLWPSQFPLLRDTKDLAAQSPMPSGLASELSKVALETYYLEPGDRLLIEPVNLESEFRAIGDQKVQVDGSIDLGQYGRLRVSGMPVEAIEVAIEERIREVSGKPESINVQLLEPNAAEVYVLGEVGSPGAYALDGHETVLDAILTAGGLTSQASPCDIVLVRPTAHCDKRVVLPVCYRQLTQIGDTTTNYQVQPGDRIVVGARTLREELSVWKQTTSCPRCNCEQKVECQPSSKRYMNRFVSWLNPFPMPRDFSQADSPESNVSSRQVENSNAKSNSERSQDGQPDTGGADSDKDLFLPAIPEPESAPAIGSNGKADSAFLVRPVGPIQFQLTK